MGNYLGNDVNVLLNEGDGAFIVGSNSPYAAGGGILSVASADVDGAFGLDIVAASYSALKVQVLLNKGDGSFSAAMPYGVNLSGGLTAGMFHHGHLADVAYCSNDTGDVSAVEVMPNVGPSSGYFQSPTIYDTGTSSSSAQHLATADFDGKNGT